MHSGVCWRIWKRAGTCSYKHRSFLLLLLAPRTGKSHPSLVCIIMNKLMPQASPRKMIWAPKMGHRESWNFLFKKFNAQISIWANPARWLNPFGLCALNGRCCVCFSWTYPAVFLCVCGRRCSGKCYPPREQHTFCTDFSSWKADSEFWTLFLEEVATVLIIYVWWWHLEHCLLIEQKSPRKWRCQMHIWLPFLLFCLCGQVTLTLWVWAFLCLEWLITRAVIMLPPDRFSSISI